MASPGNQHCANGIGTFVLYLRAFTATNTSRSFTYKMAAIINWHRYGTIHCHPVYKL